MVLLKYARSLAEVAVSAGADETVEQDFRALLALLAGAPDFMKTMKNPAIPMSVKTGLVDEVARGAALHRFLHDFLRLLVENHRIAYLPAIFDLYLQEMNRLRGVVQAAMTTAHPLEGSRQRQLNGDLTRVLGRRVELTAQVDPDLIGGIRLEVEGSIYDGSVQRQLERLKEELAALA